MLVVKSFVDRDLGGRFKTCCIFTTISEDTPDRLIDEFVFR